MCSWQGPDRRSSRLKKWWKVETKKRTPPQAGGRSGRSFEDFWQNVKISAVLDQAVLTQ